MQTLPVVAEIVAGNGPGVAPPRHGMEMSYAPRSPRLASSSRILRFAILR